MACGQLYRPTKLWAHAAAGTGDNACGAVCNQLPSYSCMRDIAKKGSFVVILNQHRCQAACYSSAVRRTLHHYTVDRTVKEPLALLACGMCKHVRYTFRQDFSAGEVESAAI